MKATWQGVVIAESEATIVVEGNHYFPPTTVDREFVRLSETTSLCGWKGTASYYDVVVQGKVNTDAAWFYQQPKERAKQIAGYVAFWNGVEVTD